MERYGEAAEGSGRARILDKMWMKTNAGLMRYALRNGVMVIPDIYLNAGGVTPLESVGSPFDPNLHEAVSVVEGDGQESGVVHSEDRRGYLWDGELLRPSRVTVVK